MLKYVLAICQKIAFIVICKCFIVSIIVSVKENKEIIVKKNIEKTSA